MTADQAALKRALSPYLERSTSRALTLFTITLLAWTAATIAAVTLPTKAFQLLAAIAAGNAIASMFVIGHDAAHGAFTADRRLNAVIGRLAFLPALHNYSLWQIAHNKNHHVDINVQGLNSWAPLSKKEFDALPPRERLLQRIYRTPIGLGLYYLVERWWSDKFFPRSRHGSRRREIFLRDFHLLLAFAAALSAILYWVGGIAAIFWGFVLPFAVWNVMMGGTVFLQHTAAEIPWFRSRDERDPEIGQAELTVHIEVPRWYGLLSHHIMQHPVHHVMPKIPLYSLAAAQSRLNELLGRRAIRHRFSVAYLLVTMSVCRLYDYDRHQWLDFDGSPTAFPIATGGATHSLARDQMRSLVSA